MDINCDLGEGMEHDAAIMPYITSANIACGYHAGNPDIIKRTIDLCIQHQVNIGAHPSFDDKHNFGRTEVRLSEEELYDLIGAQIEIMDKAARSAGASLAHVKPHGALYNMAARDPETAVTIVRAVRDFNERLILFGLSGSHLISKAREAGITAWNEVFADRTYGDDGRLTPRNEQNALIENTQELKKHVMHILQYGKIISANGKEFKVELDTICIHGDGPHALEFAKALNDIVFRS